MAEEKDADCEPGAVRGSAGEAELVGRELLRLGNVAAERAAVLKNIKVIEVVEREAGGDDTPEEDTVAFWFGY